MSYLHQALQEAASRLPSGHRRELAPVVVDEVGLRGRGLVKDCLLYTSPSPRD